MKYSTKYLSMEASQFTTWEQCVIIAFLLLLWTSIFIDAQVLHQWNAYQNQLTSRADQIGTVTWLAPFFPHTHPMYFKEEMSVSQRYCLVSPNKKFMRKLEGSSQAKQLSFELSKTSRSVKFPTGVSTSPTQNSPEVFKASLKLTMFRQNLYGNLQGSLKELCKINNIKSYWNHFSFARSWSILNIRWGKSKSKLFCIVASVLLHIDCLIYKSWTKALF